MRNFLILFALFLTISGCSKKIIPNYTTVQEIYNLKKGMSLDRVNATLGIGPYEFYTTFEGGDKVLVYKYKKQYQLIPSNELNDREGLSGGGTERYKNEGDLYIVFDQKTNEMVYFVTTKGREIAKKIINESNQLRLLKLESTPNTTTSLTTKTSVRKATKAMDTKVVSFIREQAVPVESEVTEKNISPDATVEIQEKKAEEPLAEKQSEKADERKVEEEPKVVPESKDKIVEKVAEKSPSNTIDEESSIPASKETPKAKPVEIGTNKKLPVPSFLGVCSAVAKENDAKKLSAALGDLGYPSGYLWIPDYDASGKKLFRVYIGPFKSKEATDGWLQEIKPIYPNAYFLLLK